MTNEELKGFSNEQLVCMFQDATDDVTRDRLSAAIVKKNSSLVQSLAHKYKIINTDFSDRYQDGMIGLLNAMGNFDRNMKAKFSTHAWNWIKQSILREGNKQGNIIQTPSNIAEARMKINKVKSQFEKDNGRFATAEDIVKLTNLKLSEVQHILQQQGTVASSLDAPVATDEDKMDAHALHGGAALDASMLEEHNLQLLKQALEHLHPNQRILIECRLGLNENNYVYSYEELSGIVRSVKGKILGSPSTVKNHYDMAISEILKHIKQGTTAKSSPKVTKTVTPQIATKELSFRDILQEFSPEDVLVAISKLHPNEAFILESINGIKSNDNKVYSFESLAGKVQDSQGTTIEKSTQVKAEYRQILLTLKNNM